MSNHPSPDQIKSARAAANLTQTAAAALLYKECNTWQKWEDGSRRMDPALWELFKLKINSHQLEKKS